MTVKVGLPLAAAVGLAFAVGFVIWSYQPQQVARPVALPPQSPYESFVAGEGIVEAASENIAIATHVAGVVTDLYVRVGDRMLAGAPLFKVDDRALRAELATRRKALQVAQEQLERLRSQPRPEEIPPAEARVKSFASLLADQRNRLEILEAVTDPRAVVEEDKRRLRYAILIAEANLAEARAQLELLKAGAWMPDVQIAEAQVQQARALVEETQTQIELHTVRAPIEGKVLQVNIRRGEYAPTGIPSTPLMLMGATRTLHLRVDIDENDAWRVRRGARGMAYVRGNRALRTPIEFVRFEPAIVPKRSLTGESTERVDTRVLQVLYRFDPSRLPVYVGQLMDVYIEARPHPRTSP